MISPSTSSGEVINQDGEKSSNTGVIVAVVVVVIFALLITGIALGLSAFYYNRKKKSGSHDTQNAKYTANGASRPTTLNCHNNQELPLLHAGATSCGTATTNTQSNAPANGVPLPSNVHGTHVGEQRRSTIEDVTDDDFAGDIANAPSVDVLFHNN